LLARGRSRPALAVIRRHQVEYNRL
jgi:hypothetical protein